MATESTVLRAIRVRIALLVCVMAMGCSGPPEGFVPATGAFKMADGSPLIDVQSMVRFDPYDPNFIDDGTAAPDFTTPQGTSCTAWLQADGQFVLTTHPYGKVAEFGHYKVQLVLFNLKQDGAKVPEIYRLFESTPWRAEIKVGEKNEFEFIVVN